MTRYMSLYHGRARGPGDHLFEERPDGRFPRIREVRMGLAPRSRGRLTDPGPVLRPQPAARGPQPALQRAAVPATQDGDQVAGVALQVLQRDQEVGRWHRPLAPGDDRGQRAII